MALKSSSTCDHHTFLKSTKKFSQFHINHIKNIFVVSLNLFHATVAFISTALSLFMSLFLLCPLIFFLYLILFWILFIFNFFDSKWQKCSAEWCYRHSVCLLDAPVIFWMLLKSNNVNPDSRSWEWTLKTILATSISNQIISSTSRKMRSLNHKFKDTLKQAICCSISYRSDRQTPKTNFSW